MTSTRSRTRRPGRTRLITAASIGAVGLAGLFAVGANLGVLAGADESEVGDATAAGDLVPTDTKVVDVYLDQPADPPTSTTNAAADAAAAGSQRFTVDVAGTVDVSTVAGRARLDRVTPAPGWSAAAVRADGADVAVSFTDGTRTLEFTATAGPDGAVTGDVTESSGGDPTAGPTATSSPPPVRYEADDDGSDDHESQDDDRDEGDSDHEEREYEGGDFDD